MDGNRGQATLHDDNTYITQIGVISVLYRILGDFKIIMENTCITQESVLYACKYGPQLCTINMYLISLVRK